MWQLYTLHTAYPPLLRRYPSEECRHESDRTLRQPVELHNEKLVPSCLGPVWETSDDLHVYPPIEVAELLFNGLSQFVFTHIRFGYAAVFGPKRYVHSIGELGFTVQEDGWG
jgi:hypothetical protein